MKGWVYIDVFYFVINKDGIFNLNGENDGYYIGKKLKLFFYVIVFFYYVYVDWFLYVGIVLFFCWCIIR